MSEAEDLETLRSVVIDLINLVISEITKDVWGAKARHDMLKVNELIIERGGWVDKNREATRWADGKRLDEIADEARKRLEESKEKR